jgi:transcription-repair coupling factor (superfamily II helicase)
MNKSVKSIYLPEGAISCFLSEYTKAIFGNDLLKKIVVVLPDQYSVQQAMKELEWFSRGNGIILNNIPDYEVLPYEKITPTHEIITQRLSAIWSLQQQNSQIVLTSTAALVTAVAPASYLYNHVFLLKKGQKLNLDYLIKKLVYAGYERVEHVYEAGEFAIRGGIIDVIIGKNKGIRVELCDDEIESLGYFDFKTQAIQTYKDSIELVPPTEYPNDKESLKIFADNFKQYFPRANEKLMLDYKHGILPSGLEFYLPMFFNGQKTSIIDYFDEYTEVIVLEKISDSLYNEWNLVKQQYAQHVDSYYCMKPQDIFNKPEDLLRDIKKYKVIEIKNTISENYYKDFLPLPPMRANFKDMSSWKVILELQKKYTVNICAAGLGRSETIKNTMSKHGIFSNEKLHFIISPLQQGFIYKNIAYITEYNLFERVAKEYQYNKSRDILKNDASIRDLSELAIGDFVVHIDYGVGIYKGVTQEEINDIIHELINIEYKDNAFVCVPIAHLYKISPYTVAQTVVIDKLGSKKWKQIKQKVEKQVEQVATFLLQLYADHATASGINCPVPEGYEDFASSFPYPLTKDQESSINDMIVDLTRNKAMDRLICGDVGFGKTEVAMRAAYIVAANGYQVAVIVPTTVLASQHYNTFVQRFSETALVIVELSRFKTSKEIKDNIDLIKSGRADIVVATHRLLQKDVEFANLGLLVIDEEHRFGVAQKEKLRELRNNGRHIHILTMTATPIPRTLHMALEGIKDFSIIATPPQKRLSINTIVSYDTNEVIAESVKREIRRGGQVFFLYNDVNSIVKMYHRISELMPEMHIAIAHGQMKEPDLEMVIRDFANGQYQLLLCSTIIENGIDIPQANTIIIYHADRLGLSQLYQLRGRVGRSAHQAYCYLIVPEEMSKDAQKRIDAIVNSSELGSGFNLAIHDLEIRGAGEILGESQAGNIKNIGLSLYSDMLNKAIVKKSQEASHANDFSVNTAVDIQLGVNAIIPEEYCHDSNQRLVFYKKMTQCSTEQQLYEVYQELIDKYGAPHEYVNNLLELNKLRIIAQKNGVLKIRINDEKLLVQFAANQKIDPDKLIKLVTKHFAEGMSVSVDNEICYTKKFCGLDEKIEAVDYILKSLS